MTDVDLTGMWQLIEGTLVAFCCAGLAVAVDLQDAIKSQLGKLANTSILLCWQGWASLTGWGTFDAAMYHVILANNEWATRTFGFQVDQNPIRTGLVVGISAIVIIRSKLAKIGSIEVGGEWAYLWSRARVMNAVNKRRIRKKNEWQNKFKQVVTDMTAYPTFFTDLEVHLQGLMVGRPDISTAVVGQIEDVRKQYIPVGDPNSDETVNASLRARSYLVSVALDYIGHAELSDWARQNNIPI